MTTVELLFFMALAMGFTQDQTVMTNEPVVQTCLVTDATYAPLNVERCQEA